MLLKFQGIGIHHMMFCMLIHSHSLSASVSVSVSPSLSLSVSVSVSLSLSVCLSVRFCEYKLMKQNFGMEEYIYIYMFNERTLERHY